MPGCYDNSVLAAESREEVPDVLEEAKISGQLKQDNRCSANVLIFKAFVDIKASLWPRPPALSKRKLSTNLCLNYYQVGSKKIQIVKAGPLLM